MHVRPRLSHLLATAWVGVFAVACSSSERIVEGQLAQGKFSLSNAQVIALSSDGTTYRSPVAADGTFSVALPVGGEYSLRFANTTQRAGTYDAFAVLVSRDVTGLAYRRFKVTAGAAINLGQVYPIGTKSAGLSAASDDEAEDDADSSGDDGDSDSDSSGGDDDTSEGDVEHACDLGGGDDVTVVESENGLLANVDSDEDGVSDAEDTDEGATSCDDTESDSEDADSDTDNDNDSDMNADSDSDGDSDSDSDGGDDCEVEDEPGDEVCGGGGSGGGGTGGGSTGDPNAGGQGTADPVPPVNGTNGL